MIVTTTNNVDFTARFWITKGVVFGEAITESTCSRTSARGSATSSAIPAARV